MEQNNHNQQLKENNFETRRQAKLDEQHRRQRERSIKRLTKIGAWSLVAVAVVGLIGWWGVRMSQEQTAMVARSSQNALAPDFTLPATTGGTITLSDFRGKKNVLLYFQEGLSCQPCWEQIPELEKTMPEFEKMNITLLSVALDPVEKWGDTIKQYNIKTPILSYDSVSTEKDYNLLPYSMGMGRRAGHTFVLIGTDGTIKWRKDYWPSRGHMVAGGTMFVKSDEIIANIKTALGQQ